MFENVNLFILKPERIQVDRSLFFNFSIKLIFVIHEKDDLSLLINISAELWTVFVDIHYSTGNQRVHTIFDDYILSDNEYRSKNLSIIGYAFF